MSRYNSFTERKVHKCKATTHTHILVTSFINIYRIDKIKTNQLYSSYPEYKYKGVPKNDLSHLFVIDVLSNLTTYIPADSYFIVSW